MTAPTPQQSALDWMKVTLAAWGLSSLFDTASSFLTQGYSPDEIALKLQDTPEYKVRFAGNEVRKSNGLSVLSPAEYIAVEEQYRNILQQYGMSAGFYDSHSDFNNWIGGDVSPSELEQRAQIAKQQFVDGSQEYKDAWKNYYGLSEGQAIAGILDPHHESLADLQRQAQSVAIGASGAEQGFNVTRSRAEEFAQHGTTLAQAREAYGRIAQFGQVDTSIAHRFGQQFGQTEEENALLLEDGETRRRLDHLYASEAAQFSNGGASASTATGSAGGNY